MNAYPRSSNGRSDSCLPLSSSKSRSLFLPSSDASCTSTNLRPYQMAAILSCIKHNTLVVMPTGLGKTAIGATLLANCHRWFPSSKMIFAAPTRPLVDQQFEACLRLMAIPADHMAKLTGSDSIEKRKKLWSECQIFFITPQILKNDCCNGLVDGSTFKCIILDEAHKATGNHAYCQIIETISQFHTNFRIIGLTASPGSSRAAIQSIIDNLRITKIEYRSEESLDILPHIHDQDFEKIYVDLSDSILEVKSSFLRICDHFVRSLQNIGAYNIENFNETTSFKLIQARESIRKRFRANNSKSKVIPLMEMNFASLISLSHALQLLNIYGIGVFCKFMDKLKKGEAGGKSLGPRLSKLSIHNDLMDHVHHIVDNSLNDPNILHPKMSKLIDILDKHFSFDSNSIKNTRAIVFTNYRDSVEEIVEILSHNSTTIRPCSFTGKTTRKTKSNKDQPKQLCNQKQQIEVMQKFKSNHYNCLVSTCIGEEGFDIGEVDLIICFEATKSPLRLIQRSGRTGRKRDGKIKMLLTKGIEDITQNISEKKKRNLKNSIASKNSFKFFSNDLSTLLIDGNPEDLKREYIFSKISTIECEKLNNNKNIQTSNDLEIIEDKDSCESMFSDNSIFDSTIIRKDDENNNNYDEMPKNENMMNENKTTSFSFSSNDEFVNNFLSEIINEDKDIKSEEQKSKKQDLSCHSQDPFESTIDLSKIDFVDETKLSKSLENIDKTVNEVDIDGHNHIIKNNDQYASKKSKNNKNFCSNVNDFIDFDVQCSDQDSKIDIDDLNNDDKSYSGISGSFVVNSQDAKNDEKPSSQILSTQQYIDGFFQNVTKTQLQLKSTRRSKKFIDSTSKTSHDQSLSLINEEFSQDVYYSDDNQNFEVLPSSILESSGEYDASFIDDDNSSTEKDESNTNKKSIITKKFLTSPDIESEKSLNNNSTNNKQYFDNRCKQKLGFIDKSFDCIEKQKISTINVSISDQHEKYLFIDKFEGSRTDNICLLLRDKFHFNLIPCLCYPAHYCFGHIVAILRLNLTKNLVKNYSKLTDSVNILSKSYKYIKIILEINTNFDQWDLLSVNKLSFLTNFHIMKNCQVYYCLNKIKGAELIHSLYTKFAEAYNFDRINFKNVSLIDQKFLHFISNLCDINHPTAIYLIMKFTSIQEIIISLKRHNFIISKLLN